MSERVMASHSFRKAPEAKTLQGLRAGGAAATAGGPAGTFSIRLLGEEPDLYVVVLLVDVDRQIAELVDELIQVLRLQLRDIDVHTLLAELLIDLLLGTGRDEAGQAHARA